MEKKIKVVLAKPGLDIHELGIKVISKALTDAGMEVVYLGINQTPEKIIKAAKEEDVDAIGLSILDGSHMGILRELLSNTRAEGIDHVPVIVGGTIPQEEAKQLKEEGIYAVFGPGAPLEKVVQSFTQATKVS
jgi:methylmalonyl-CoA mutase C-terminal domain/subunit